MNNQNPEMRLAPEEVTAVYKIPEATLKIWRHRRRHNHEGNQGPRFEVCGARKVLYRVKDIEEWLAKSSLQEPRTEQISAAEPSKSNEMAMLKAMQAEIAALKSAVGLLAAACYDSLGEKGVQKILSKIKSPVGSKYQEA
jgi:hypothetical protein